MNDLPDIKKCFPGLEVDIFYPPSCKSLISSTDCEVFKDLEVGDCQGDYLMAVRQNGLFGFVVVGFGSCEGCDVLKACENYEDLDKFRYQIYNSIIWRELSDFVDYLKTKDWDGEFYYAGNEVEIKEFVDETINDALLLGLAGV